jgi:hypothetical protein
MCARSKSRQIDLFLARLLAHTATEQSRARASLALLPKLNVMVHRRSKGAVSRRVFVVVPRRPNVLVAR